MPAGRRKSLISLGNVGVNEGRGRRAQGGAGAAKAVHEAWTRPGSLVSSSARQSGEFGAEGESVCAAARRAGERRWRQRDFAGAGERVTDRGIAGEGRDGTGLFGGEPA